MALLPAPPLLQGHHAHVSDAGLVRPRVSLLHATHRRPGGPRDVRDAWLRAALRPHAIEYLVSMDADDLESLEHTTGWRRLVNGGDPGGVSAVQNWNAAALAATGDLLFIIADDLTPPEGWDEALVRLCGPLDPRRVPFAIKVSDDPSATDVKLRHPVVSRAFYEAHGMFGPDYRGLYCDDDLTARAFWKAVILDGRSLRLDHRHPSLDSGLDVSQSQRRMNRSAEYEFGRAVYLSTWSKRQRLARRRLVGESAVAHLTERRARLLRRWLNVAASLGYAFGRAGRAGSVLWHGGRGSVRKEPGF